MHSFDFRPAGPEEKELIAALYASAKGRPFCTWSDDYPGLFEIEEDLASGGLYVMTEDDGIVGIISVLRENELDDLDCWTVPQARELSRVFIRPDRQGQGLSHLLVQKAMDLLKRQGCLAVHLSVADRNIPAQKLYTRLGFEKRGEGARYGLYFYFMEKRLASD